MSVGRVVHNCLWLTVYHMRHGVSLYTHTWEQEEELGGQAVKWSASNSTPSEVPDHKVGRAT